MIFSDRSIPRSVAQTLQCVRDDVRWLEDVFPHDTPDAAWLLDVGARGWLVVSRDKKIRTRPGEHRALMHGNVGCFCFTQKQPLTRWTYLRLLVTTLDQMERVFAWTPRPFLCSVGREGQMRLIALESESGAPPASPP